ncbi:MAG TPA: hypothetical protein VKA62_00760, partial [Agromyces sp.]|nr:hypothetical protein [Agromyces sp.]
MRRLTPGHGQAEHEELRERREVGGCPVVGSPGVEHAARRHALAAMQRGRGIRPPESLQRVDRERGRLEVGAEPLEQCARAPLVGRRRVFGAHRTIQPQREAGAHLVARSSTMGNGPNPSSGV